MTLYTGTSGFSFAAWKGPFYPEKHPSAKMLAYYAEKLSTVEINNTFYRMPKPEVLQGWASETPERFRFSFKAPQVITHRKKLVDAGDAVMRFLEVTGVLGPRVGVLLFQTPPFLKMDLAVLDAFLALLPKNVRAAFEFRHASWNDETVFAKLRSHNAALCIAETDESGVPELVRTADFGYVRLRKTTYDDAEVNAWRDRLAGVQEWRDTFVYFKHEDDGIGPKLALTLAK